MSDKFAEPAGSGDARQDLRADCARCVGLCCVAPGFAASAEFAVDKPAGQPCPNLGRDFGCRIHGSLRERGFSGCDVFDCFGAGQQVVQVTFGGRDWRESPKTARSMFIAFTAMRQLHQLLWYLAEGWALLPMGALRDEVDHARNETYELAAAGVDELVRIDVAAHRGQVGPLLDRISRALRADVASHGPDLVGVDLVGADLRDADLRGISLRGAILLGVDLRGVDLHRTDLLGTDLRGADVRGAHLATSLFLTQPQVHATRGDASTTLAPELSRPRHWDHSAEVTAGHRSAGRRRGRGHPGRRS